MPAEALIQPAPDHPVAPDAAHRPGAHVTCRLSMVLAARGMELADLAAQTGLRESRLAVLIGGDATGMRFRTLATVCQALGVTPGDLLELED